ncbi:MAG: CBS domain-containing protein [Pseudomonadota bacterium]
MLTARDVMVRTFHTLSPKLSIEEAAKLFKKTSELEQRRIFGMIVIDQSGRLIGMMSMYDILLFIRPKHVQVWGMMEDINIAGLMEEICSRAKSVLVEDIMTTDLITVTPDTSVMFILDIMITKHIRRIPVIENGKVEGIVYLSDLFFRLIDELAP